MNDPEDLHTTAGCDGALLALAGVVGFLGVALGAFGAHGLSKSLDAEHLAWFETGVRYHLFHAPMIAICALLAGRGVRARTAGFAFAIGIALFSFSLYAIALGAPRACAMITPFGGLVLLIGWAALAIAGFRGVARSAGAPRSR